MKRFFISMFGIALLFVGLGVVIEGVSAKFKSDEKALEIIRAAKTAIGGESKVREVRSLVITGKTTQTHKIGDIEKTSVGDTEIALQFPNKLMKTIKIGDGDGDGTKMRSMSQEVTVVGKGDGNKTFTVIGKDGEFKTSDGQVFKVRKGDDGEIVTDDGKKIIVRSDEKVVNSDNGETKVFVRKPADGGEWKTADGKHYDVRINKVDAEAHHEGMRQNEFLRMTLSLLLSAPDGIDVNYTFVGEGDVDGNAVNIVNAESAGQNYKLYIGKGNNLPLAVSFVGHPMPEIVQFNHKVPAPADGAKDVVMFKRSAEPIPNAEVMVKFSDFRDAGGVLLPYKWTTTAGNKGSDIFDVSSYDINPANISEKFAGQEMKVRTKKDGN